MVNNTTTKPMENKKQTAVEWLVEQYDKSFILKVNNVMTSIIEQAKAMEVNFITEIDHRLSVIEDYAKGEAGDEITKLRKYISENYGK